MKVAGELAEEHPRHCAQLPVPYPFKAADGLGPKKVGRAVQLSQGPCRGVSAMRGKAARLEHRVEVR